MTSHSHREIGSSRSPRRCTGYGAAGVGDGEVAATVVPIPRRGHRTRWRRPVPTEPDGTDEHQRHADDEEYQTENEQREHGRSEQIDMDSGLHIHADPRGPVGVHDHDGPRAVA
ncbi:hypothetical protein [Rhodococcus pyridinivorans]|uniref:hypothetical protein n=1 Tax=Rhodococcus pyridinivorans TaxID=103816 RepID=UPI0039B6B65E